jgi:hypothetical protein
MDTKTYTPVFQIYGMKETREVVGMRTNHPTTDLDEIRIFAGSSYNLFDNTRYRTEIKSIRMRGDRVVSVHFDDRPDRLYEAEFCTDGAVIESYESGALVDAFGEETEDGPELRKVKNGKVISETYEKGRSTYEFRFFEHTNDILVVHTIYGGGGEPGETYCWCITGDEYGSNKFQDVGLKLTRSVADVLADMMISHPTEKLINNY